MAGQGEVIRGDVLGLTHPVPSVPEDNRWPFLLADGTLVIPFNGPEPVPLVERRSVDQPNQGGD
jgi:hypothetical protein